VSAVIWLVAFVVVVVLADGWLTHRRNSPKADEGTYQVIVALHLIRRRLQVSQFKLEARQEATARRHQLSDELREMDRQKREP
jgi:hypothetical protein